MKMTNEDIQFYVSVIEKMAKGEDVSDEELIRFSGDDHLFDPYVGEKELTDDDLQQMVDSLSSRVPTIEHSNESDDGGNDFYQQLMPYLSNQARMWLRRKGEIDQIDIVDLNDYREASSFNPTESSIQNKEQLWQSLSVQLEKLNGIREYVSELFFSTLLTYETQTLEYTDTLGHALVHVTEGYNCIEKLLDMLSASHGRE